jgi:hypothetical protein
MSSARNLRSLLEPRHGVPYTEDFDAMVIAKNLTTGNLTKNFKELSPGNWELNIKDSYTLEDLLNESPKDYTAEDYYLVPYSSIMWQSIDQVKAQANVKKSIESVPGISFQEKLDFLSKCDCCVRHNTGKIRCFTENPWTQEYSTDNECLPPFRDCKCNCRHMSRVITREYQKIK